MPDAEMLRANYVRALDLTRPLLLLATQAREEPRELFERLSPDPTKDDAAAVEKARERLRDDLLALGPRVREGAADTERAGLAESLARLSLARLLDRSVLGAAWAEVQVSPEEASAQPDALPRYGQAWLEQPLVRELTEAGDEGSYAEHRVALEHALSVTEEGEADAALSVALAIAHLASRCDPADDPASALEPELTKRLDAHFAAVGDAHPPLPRPSVEPTKRSLSWLAWAALFAAGLALPVAVWAWMHHSIGEAEEVLMDTAQIHPDDRD